MIYGAAGVIPPPSFEGGMMMLGQVCDFVHNYFVCDSDSHSGTFTVSNGTIDLPFVLDGQRFRIRGSKLNDGIYTYQSGSVYDDDGIAGVTLLSETFTGTIDAMSVPRAFQLIVEDIIAWKAKNKEILDSPFISESFGGYSYSKGTQTDSKGHLGGVLTWQVAFRDQLRAYRKIA